MNKLTQADGIARYHLSLHYRVRTWGSLSQEERTRLLEYATRCAAEEDRVLIVLGLDRVTGSPVICENACIACIRFPGAWAVVGEGLEMAQFMAGEGDWRRFDHASYHIARDDGRTSRVIQLSGSAPDLSFLGGS